MRTECVAPSLSHFPPNAAVHPPASPQHSCQTHSLLKCVQGVVEVLLRSVKHVLTFCYMLCTLHRCCSGRVLLQHPTVCPAAYSRGLCGAARLEHNAEEGRRGDKYSSPSTGLPCDEGKHKYERGRRRSKIRRNSTNKSFHISNTVKQTIQNFRWVM